jgi:hypothetical protein
VRLVLCERRWRRDRTPSSGALPQRTRRRKFAFRRSTAHALEIVAADVRDLDLRQRALEHIRGLSQRYDDVVPVDILRAGFESPHGRISYGSFYNGIYRPKQFVGPAALSLVTAPPKERRDATYDDEYDEES